MDAEHDPIVAVDAVLDAALAAGADRVHIEPAENREIYTIAILRHGELLAVSTIDAALAGHTIARLGYVCQIDPSGARAVTGRTLIRSCDTDGDLVVTITPGTHPRAELLFIGNGVKHERANEPIVGARIGHYWVIRKLGAGGMGEVYEVEHEALGTRAALKLLQRSAIERDGGQAIERFLHEARATARIHSPHVVEVYDFGYLGDRPYFVMELLPAGNLEDVLVAGAVPPLRAVAIARQLVSALATTHAHGVVHADVAPANISVERDRVKLIDFGLAQLLHHAGPRTRADFVTGTPHYLSPEQIQGYPASEASDQYATGAVLFEMLSGHPPFHGGTSEEVCRAHVHAPIPPVTSPFGAVPPALAAAVARCLAKRPADRHPSMQGVQAALGGIGMLA